jgi:RNA polymerase sigma factor (sigma-70 family)
MTMRVYQAQCDECGDFAPRRQRGGVAERDIRNHDCATYTPPTRRVRGAPRSPTDAAARRVVDDPHGLMRIARAVAAETVKRLPRLAGEYDDILSDAAYGIAKAVERHDPSRGASLSTYAMMRARNEVLDGIRDRGPLTRRELGNGVKLASLPAHRRTPTSVEAHREEWGTDLPVPDPTSGADFEAVDARLTVIPLLAMLRPNEKLVLEGMYLHGRTLADLARELGVTESRACQLHKSGLASARSHVASRALVAVA